MVTWCACVVCFSEIWKDNNLEGMNRAFSNISLWSNFLKNDQLISSLFCPLPYCEKPNLFTFIWLKTVQVASFLKNAFDMLPLHAPISFVKEKFCNIVWSLEINLKIMRQQNRDPYLFATTTHGLLFSLSTGLETADMRHQRRQVVYFMKLETWVIEVTFWLGTHYT